MLAYSLGECRSSRQNVGFRSHGLLQIKQGTLRRLRSASVGAGQTSTGRFAPLRWLPPATLLWTCHLGDTLRYKLFPADKFYKISLYFDGRVKYNEVNGKAEVDCEKFYIARRK